MLLLLLSENASFGLAKFWFSGTLKISQNLVFRTGFEIGLPSLEAAAYLSLSLSPLAFRKQSPLLRMAYGRNEEYGNAMGNAMT